jgi:hypothetical protein
MILDVVPAYGRRFKDGHEALAHWQGGKDWRVAHQGPYTSIRDTRFLMSKGFRHVRLMWGHDLWTDNIIVQLTMNGHEKGAA